MENRDETLYHFDDHYHWKKSILEVGRDLKCGNDISDKNRAEIIYLFIYLFSLFKFQTI